MNHWRLILGLLLLPASASAALVQFSETSVNDADGTTIAAVSSVRWLEMSLTYSTATAPASWSSYRFTHWTNDGYPAAVYRDAWGRALNPCNFVLLATSTATAHYLPATRDADGDAVPDWFELEYYGTLAHAATSDTDSDGVTLLAESTGGTNPLFPNTTQSGGVTWTDSALITCNLAGYATYVLRSVPAGTVNQSAVAPPGTVVTVPSQPGGASFGYWTLDGERQQDAWGVALTQFSFTVANTDREAVAYLLSGDSDSDGVSDAFEQRYYGTLAHGANSDTDGDGVTLLAESAAGTNPHFANATLPGGVAWTDSALITCNLSGNATYVLRSVPAGTVNQSEIVPPGTVVTVPNQPGGATFGYWTLDGARQQDAWDVALTQFNFTVEDANREAVAYLFSGDSDSDGVPDAFEQRYYGTLAHGATSDTDGDGVTLLAESTAGTNPLHGNAAQAGGVVWVDTALLTANLQAEIALEQPSGTALTDGGQSGFGDVLVAATADLEFTIRNHGGGDLTGLTVTLDGENATAFALVTAPVAPVPHLGHTTFTVRFAPTSIGSKTAVLHVASNDADEASYEITLTGTGLNNPPTIQPIADLSTARNTSSSVSVVLGDVETPLSQLSVTVNSAQPTLLPADNLVLSGSGATRTLTLTPEPDQTGTAVVTVSVSDGDLMAMRTFSFVVTAYPPSVTTGDANELTTTAATVHGLVNARGFATAAHFAYGLTTDYDRMIAATPPTVSTTSAEAFSARLEGLVPATTYHYRLVATSNQGEGSGADGVFTTLGVAPAIGTPPQSQTVTVGDDVTFTVVATGLPAPTYQWSKDNVEILGATSATLTLTAVRTSDAGDYTVRVANVVGAVTSSPATLAVEKRAQAIAFAELPPVTPLTAPFALSASASSGLPVTFASSNPAVATIEQGLVTVTGLGTAIITASQLGDEDWAAATDVTRELVVGTTLTVVLLEDEFDAAAGSAPDETKYVWSGEVANTGGGQMNLTTQAVQHSWIRSKSAAAIGADDVLQLRFRAYAYAEHWNPGVYGNGQPRGLRVGTDANNVIEFHSVSRTSVGLRARRDGVESSQVVAFPAGVDSMHDYEIVVTATAATFKIDDVVVGVLASNLPLGSLGFHASSDDGGGTGNVPISLERVSLALRTELSAPSIVTPPTDITVEVGASVNFTVAAVGTAPLSYTWSKDGEILTSATEATLTFANVEWTDAGDYSVTVRNPIGRADAPSVRLTVTHRAQTITFPPLDDRLFSREPIPLVATASSGLPVVFTVISGPGEIRDGALHVTAPGIILVRATQAGDALYGAALSVEREVLILTSYLAWQDGYFTAEQRADANVSGPTVVLAGDGCANLLKYALGLNPWLPARALGELSVSADAWRFTYRRPADRADVTFVVLTSRDLVGWSTTDVVHQKIGDDGENEIWQASVSRTVAHTVFFRLKAQRQN